MTGSRKNSVHKYTQIPVKGTVHAPHDLAIMMISLTVLSYAMLMMEFQMQTLRIVPYVDNDSADDDDIWNVKLF